MSCLVECERWLAGTISPRQRLAGCNRTNRHAHVLPRQIAMYIARQLTGASLQQIGQEFGHRHHTTTLHSIRKIEEIRGSDIALDAIRRLTDAIAQHLTSICSDRGTTVLR